MKENTDVYSKLFTWLFIGLLITFVTGYALSLNEQLLVTVLTIGIIPIVIAEVVIALLLGIRIHKMKPSTVKICYILFSICTGVTFGTLFATFKLSSIIFIFAVTSLIFDALALSSLSVLIFTGYIAYDMQKVKVMLPTLGEEKTAVYGAFQLYLDFINLLIRLLQLFGKRDD